MQKIPAVTSGGVASEYRGRFRQRPWESARSPS